MFLLEPSRTPYDLNFYIGDIHVRVHPLFWLMALLIGGLSGGAIGINVLIGVLIIFFSILIHELGHAFTMRYYGLPARVVLYLMGGFATTQSENIWEVNSFRPQRQSPLEWIIISAAGPAAGFVLAAAVVGIAYAAGWRIYFSFTPETYFLPWWDIVRPDWRQIPQHEDSALFAVFVLLYVNIYWGILNLLPVYPLDGGQIARQVCVLRDPYEGIRQSLWISVVAGAAVAVLGLVNQHLMLAIMFASFAYSSYQALQQYSGGGRW